MRGKVALLIPKTITAAGSKNLITELKSKQMKVHDAAENLVFVPFDRKVRKDVSQLANFGALVVDRITPAQMRALPPESRRVGELWNWNLANRGKRITDGAVTGFMKKLQLKIDAQNNVVDTLTHKQIGKVKEKEGELNKGNWYIYVNWGWTIIPGWCGYWRKYYTRTRTYTSSTRKQRYIVDLIIAEVDGPHHYAYHSRYNGSSAYAYDWAYIWAWEASSDWCEHWGYARKGSASLQITHRS